MNFILLHPHPPSPRAACESSRRICICRKWNWRFFEERRIFSTSEQDSFLPGLTWSKKICFQETRPETRPRVADGWAGVDMRVYPLFDLCWRTDGPMDGRTDGRTKALIELRVRNIGCVCIYHLIWIFYLDINIRIFYIVNSRTTFPRE